MLATLYACRTGKREEFPLKGKNRWNGSTSNRTKNRNPNKITLEQLLYIKEKLDKKANSIKMFRQCSGSTADDYPKPWLNPQYVHIGEGSNLYGATTAYALIYRFGFEVL